MCSSDLPKIMRTSGEIDAYPANYLEWEAAPDNEGFIASEEINALFGVDSNFEDAHGFYIDGCDGTTARLPPGWEKRAVYRDVSSYGKAVTIVAPCTDDMALSKLVRLVEKDKGWLSSHHEQRPLDKNMLLTRLRESNVRPEIYDNAANFLSGLPDRIPQRIPLISEIPLFPPDTHCAFVSPRDNSIVVRKWDSKVGLYHRIDNPLGPAIVSGGTSRFVLDGRALSEEEWHARVRPGSTQGADPKPKP